MSPPLDPPRHVLVTGASSGLGAGLARSYARPGVSLALVGRSPARLAMVAEACRSEGAEVRIAALDVAAADLLGGWLQSVQSARPLDLVIANAGTSGGPKSLGKPEGLASAARQVGTNLLGCMNTLEPLLPALLSRPGAHVALVSSVAAYRGLPFSPAYSASKAGVRAYGEGLRGLLRPAGLTVSVIVPGFFDSPMTDRFHGATPMKCTLDQAVAVVRRGLDRRAPRIVFPRLLAVGLQVADLLPAFCGDVILQRVAFRILSNPGDRLLTHTGTMLAGE